MAEQPCRKPKPNRKRIRTFKTCDAVRICHEVISDDNTSPEALLACIAQSMGFTHLSMSRTRVIQSAQLPSLLTLRTLLLQMVRLIDRLLDRYKLPIAVIGILARLKKVIDDITDLIEEEPPPQKKVGDLIDRVKCNCKTTNRGTSNG